ncbi:MAG TPA: type II toxin-antitoxin system prevent-host-death family antitoxin [Candidatus Paceibacterota bacterium]
MKNTIIGLKELREKAAIYIDEVKKGKSFIVVRRSKPIFKLSSPNDESEFWEPVIDFTGIKKGGVLLREVLSRL